MAKNLIVDIDGCLYDFVGALRSYVTEIGVVKDAPDPKTYYFAEEWGLSRPSFNYEYQRFVAGDGLTCRGPEPGAVEALSAAKRLGFKVIIATARGTTGDPIFDRKARTDTVGWLNWNGVPHDGLAFLDDKRPLILAADAVIEDKPDAVEFAADSQRVKAICFDRSYNAEARCDYRIRTWEQLLPILQEVNEAS